MKQLSYTHENGFTIREKEVLNYISLGFSSKQIAERLYISINTVANHRRNMLHKKGASNSAELVKIDNS